MLPVTDVYDKACVVLCILPTCSSSAGACARAGRTVPPGRSSELADSSPSPPTVASPEPAVPAHLCKQTQQRVTIFKQLFYFNKINTEEMSLNDAK